MPDAGGPAGEEEDAGAHGGRQGRQPPAVQAVGGGRGVRPAVVLPPGPVGERLVVGSQEGGRAGQPAPDARAEALLQVGEQRAGPGAGVRRVVVVRVGPGPEPGLGAGGGRGGAVEGQQRAAVRAAVARHPAERPGAGAAEQPEQDGLGLVVGGVAEQHRHGAGAVGGRLQRGVPGGAGRGLRPLAGAGGDRDGPGQHGVEPEVATARGRAGRDGGRAGLQAVVDDDRARTQTEPGCHERGGRGERQGVRTAAAGDQHEAVLGKPGEVPAYRRPYCRPRPPHPHLVAVQSGFGRRIRSTAAGWAVPNPVWTAKPGFDGHDMRGG